MSINNKKPYDPITSLPSHVKQRFQTHQNTHMVGLNSQDVVSVTSLGITSVHEFEDGTKVVSANAWLPGKESSTGIDIKYRSLIDEASNSDYSSDL